LATDNGQPFQPCLLLSLGFLLGFFLPFFLPFPLVLARSSSLTAGQFEKDGDFHTTNNQFSLRNFQVLVIGNECVFRNETIISFLCSKYICFLFSTFLFVVFGRLAFPHAVNTQKVFQQLFAEEEEADLRFQLLLVR